MKIICVIGMGRSGTSLLSQILSRLGVYFGEPGELLGATPNNERGHYEHAGINGVLNGMLADNDMDWLTADPIPEDWYSSEHREIAQRTITEDLASLMKRAPVRGREVLGFKNPRTALFLPLFESVFESLDLEPIYLRCLRDPHEVYESVKRVQQVYKLSLRECLGIWANYYTQSQAVDALDVWFEDWFGRTHDIVDQLQRIMRYIGISTMSGSELGAIDPNLRHVWHKRHVRIIERVE